MGAPLDVKVPAQNTGLGPEKTSFFQALQIPTKIARGTIEIINDVALIATGDKVGASEAALLNMLGISPFSYGLVISHVYDNGSVFSPKVLDITDDDIKEKFMAGIANIACVSLAIGVRCRRRPSCCSRCRDRGCPSEGRGARGGVRRRYGIRSVRLSVNQVVGSGTSDT